MGPTKDQRHPVWLTRRQLEILDLLVRRGGPGRMWDRSELADLHRSSGAINEAILEADNQVKRVLLGCSRHPTRILICPACSGARRRPAA